MKKYIFIFAALASCCMSCKTNEENPRIEKKVQFSISTIVYQGTAEPTFTADLAYAVVTLKNSAGVADRKELKLKQVNGTYSSQSLTLLTESDNAYELTEFIVLDESRQVVYATPRAGGTFASLVRDPLNITFSMDREVAVVSVEVVAVDGPYAAGDFGYSQFGFEMLKVIHTSFTGFIAGHLSEPVDCHLKIQGLRNQNETDTVSLWTYRTALRPHTTTLKLREATRYRITATKEGYEVWSKEAQLTDNQGVWIEFHPVEEPPIDIYLGGSALLDNGVRAATYWKNGVPAHIDTDRSTIFSMVVAGDVYAIGSDQTLEGKAFYWKNAEQFVLKHPGTAVTSGIYVQGKDVYVSGALYENIAGPTTPLFFTPVYWKNGQMFSLNLPESDWRWANTTGIHVEGTDIYVGGHKRKFNEAQTDFYSNPVLWQNGTMADLPLRPGYAQSVTHGLVFKDGHTYSLERSYNAVNQTYFFGYWKGLNWTDLHVTATVSNLLRGTSTPVIDNDDFYFVTQTGAGKYYKNGEVFQPSPEVVNREVYGFSIFNGSVYACGQVLKKVPGPYTGAYWINGELHELNNNELPWCMVVKQESPSILPD